MRKAHGMVAGWAGQSGVLAPWDVTEVAAPGLRRHLPSTSDLGIKYSYMTFNIINN